MPKKLSEKQRARNARLRQEAEARAEQRAQRTPQQQIELAKSRPGASRREITRLEREN